MERGQPCPDPPQRTLTKLGAGLARLDQALGLDNGNLAAFPTPNDTPRGPERVRMMRDAARAADEPRELSGGKRLGRTANSLNPRLEAEADARTRAARWGRDNRRLLTFLVLEHVLVKPDGIHDLILIRHVFDLGAVERVTGADIRSGRPSDVLVGETIRHFGSDRNPIDRRGNGRSVKGLGKAGQSSEPGLLADLASALDGGRPLTATRRLCSSEISIDAALEEEGPTSA